MQTITYLNKNYCVYLTTSSKSLFIIDEHNKELIDKHPWNLLGNGYIGYTSNTTFIYLHRHLFGQEFDGSNYIDHISRNTRDNRDINLRIVSQTKQNHNQTNRERGTNLPKDSGIHPDDIPRHIYYISANGNHSDGFCIEINGLSKNISESGRYLWKNRNSKLTLKEKLNIAVLKLKELRNTYPELKEIIKINEDDEVKRKELIDCYNEIIKCTNFPKEIINANLFEFKTDVIVPTISNKEEEVAEILLENQNSGKKTDDNLPEGSIKKSDIPKYCYYVPATSTRGDKFVIDKHPKLLEKDLRQLSTPESKLLSTKEKFDILLEYLHCLENNLPIVKKEAPKGKRGQFMTEEQKEASYAKKEERRKLPQEVILEVIELPPETISNTNKSDSSDIPRYIYYKSSDGEHGSYWYIRDHPKLASRNLRVKTSRTSALLTDKEKYDEILQHLEALENDREFPKFEIKRAVKNQIHKEKSMKAIPNNWDLEKYPIPDGVFYRPADEKRGDCWMTKKNGKLVCSTTSKTISTLDKFLEFSKVIISE